MHNILFYLQDIQLRGVNRDEKNIKMAAQFPNSRHFLTFKHSLRVYTHSLFPIIFLLFFSCLQRVPRVMYQSST